MKNIQDIAKLKKTLIKSKIWQKWQMEIEKVILNHQYNWKSVKEPSP